MSKARELRELLTDSSARALVAHENLYAEHAADVVPGTSVRIAVTTSERDFQTRDDPRVFAGVTRVRAPGTEDLCALLDAHAGRHPAPVATGPDDVAFLTYTSGTTGPPKGAMNTHRNVVFAAQVYRDWIELGPADTILGVAPLFHITGIVGHTALALLLPAPLVLAYRFDPAVMLDAVREHRPTFTVGAITAYIALLNAPGADRATFRSLTKAYSGGAPIPPTVVHAFADALGPSIHNIYGLTETTSPSHAVPLGASAPVDPVSGALSVGVPVYDTVVRVVGEDGAELPPGGIGELVTYGPQVVPGYWGKPEETEHALGGGGLLTGDVGYMDEDGWFYLVDRKKDQINAGGYKVWPREVEDVLYEHPSVREAAVVGVPDAYRGETVKAYVSLRPGTAAEPADLIAFCRERMAAYKYPRQVEIRDELPKTNTGKLLRRALRDRG
jgi:long-chain acyl-CoA synthetase